MSESRNGGESRYSSSSICNKLNIDIFDCLKEKEKKNISRVWKK